MFSGSKSEEVFCGKWQVISERQAKTFYFNFSGDKAAKVLKSCFKCSKSLRSNQSWGSGWIRIIFISLIWIRITFKIQKRLNIEPWRAVDAHKSHNGGLTVKNGALEGLLTRARIYRRSFREHMPKTLVFKIGSTNSGRVVADSNKSRISIKTMPIHNTGSNYIASWRN